MRKIFSIIIVVVLIALFGFLYWRYFFVYAEGTKAGVLNTIQKKGFIFKTYEGKIIQTGFSNSPNAAIQSNYFDFSVSSERVAKILMENSGKEMELHYNRYLGALPWRGMQSYVVDSVYRIGNAKTNLNAPFQ
ncbi:hypothetical protein EXU57_10705 [Segetibacter sp. 3557_3]|uniref:hypothetical protein n=1 Tax=Segetibacter sp. 3557_3 TaxID=2547429 RepID=UPI0010584C7B|nr:hypothetical protein [Segetibacter sp. 3557_3]TDH26552.1 hypothetical protein EXU57_10705 [Segetibacter sp. 3557_3]